MATTITLHAKKHMLPEGIVLKGIEFPDVIVFADSEREAGSEFLAGVISSMIADLVLFSKALSSKPNNTVISKHMKRLTKHGLLLKGYTVYDNAIPIKPTTKITKLIDMYLEKSSALIDKLNEFTSYIPQKLAAKTLNDTNFFWVQKSFN